MFKIIILILLFSNLSSGKNDGYIKLEPIGKSYVKGEPLYFRFIGYDLSRGNYLDGKPCVAAQRVIGCRFKLKEDNGVSKGKERIKKQIKEVNFPLQDICDFRIKDMPAGRHELCHEEENVKICTEFEIKEPEGIDKEVFEKYIKPDDWDILAKVNANYLNIREDLLEKYPTSTYAGWAFKRKGGVGLPYIKDKKAYEIHLKKVKKILNGIEYKEIVKEFYKHFYIADRFNEEKFEEEIEDMKSIKEFSIVFTNANPDFSFGGYILAWGGYNALYLGEFNQACNMLKRSIDMKWQKPYIKKEDYVLALKEVIKLLEEKGFCK